MALFHFGEGNLSGGPQDVRVPRPVSEALSPFYAGLDLTGFEQAMEDCFAELIQAGREYPHGARLPSDRIPRLSRFRQPRVAGRVRASPPPDLLICGAMNPASDSPEFAPFTGYAPGFSGRDAVSSWARLGS